MSERYVLSVDDDNRSVSEKLVCNGITFEKVVHRDAFRMPRHAHDEAHLAFLCRGCIENSKPGKTDTVSQSALLFMPPGEAHASRYSAGVQAFYIAFAEEWWAKVPGGEKRLGETAVHQSDPSAALAKRLCREFEKRDDLTPFLLEGLTMELVVALSRGAVADAERTAPRWLQQTEAYLREHYACAPAVEDIARLVGVHPGHVMRGFRQHHGCTIGDYIRRLRIEKACGLMAGSEQTLAEVALSVGFADQSHFSKTFKGVMGATPTEWLREAGDVRRKQRMFGTYNTPAG